MLAYYGDLEYIFSCMAISAEAPRKTRARKGGLARAKTLSPERRREIAAMGGRATAGSKKAGAGRRPKAQNVHLSKPSKTAI